MPRGVIVVVGVIVATFGFLASGCGGGSQSKPTPTPALPISTTSPAATPQSRPTASDTPTTVPTTPELRTIVLDTGPHGQPPSKTVWIGQPPTSPFPAPPAGHTVIYDTQTSHEVDLGTGAQPAWFSPDSTKAVWTQGEPENPRGIALIDLSTGAIRSLGSGRHASFVDDTHVAVMKVGSNDCDLIDLTSGARSPYEVYSCSFYRPEAPSRAPGYELKTVAITDVLPRQMATYRIDVVESASQAVVLRFDGAAAVFAGNGKVLAQAPPVDRQVNLYLVDIATGAAVFVATASQPLEVGVNDDFVLWTDDFCSPSPGLVTLFDRATGRITRLDDGATDGETIYSLRYVRFTASGLIVGGPFGGWYIIDPATLTYHTSLPKKSNTSWSPDYRYASSGYVGGHGGVC